MAEGPTPTLGLAAKLHAHGDSDHPLAASAKVVADKIQHAYEDWMEAAHHAAHAPSYQASQASASRWQAYLDSRVEGKQLMVQIADIKF